jgi:hypothetical protein
MDETTTITQTQLATMLGVTARRVRQLAAEGVVEAAGERGHYLLFATVRGMLAAAEGRSEPDALRQARLKLMEAQRQRIEQDIAERQGTAADLDWQRNMIEAIADTMRADMLRTSGWLFGWMTVQATERERTDPRAIAETVHTWICGIAAETKDQFLAAADYARARGIRISDHRQFGRLIAVVGGRPHAADDDEAAETG